MSLWASWHGERPKTHAGAGRATPSQGQKHDPTGLKEWIDNVIVPALVREFVAEMQEQNKLALADNSPLLSVTEPKILASTRELQ
jgi:phosphopantothenoylcysteine synthetase/decarboxylase